MASEIRATWLLLLIFGLVVLWVFLERSPAKTGNAVVLRWVVNSQERDQLFAQAVRRAFEAKHPGIRIQFIKTNEGRKVETMIAGGDAPDIILAEMNRIHYFIRAGVLRDLTSLMTASNRADLANFFPVTVEPFQSGHRVYAIPWGYVPFILFYNKNLFDKHRIPYPHDNWNWEDYRRAARQLTHDLDHDGITDEFGASFAQWQEGYYCWFYQNGGGVLSPDGQHATFEDDRVVEAVNFLHRLTRLDRVMPTDINKPKQAGMNLFESNRLAMHGPTGSFYITTYRTFEKIDWDIASVPAGPRGKGTMVAPLAFGVSSQSKHPREAYRLVKFLSSEEGQKILGDSGLFVPCRREVALSSGFLNGGEAPKNRYALVAMLDDRDGRKPWGITPPWSGDRWGDINDVLNQKLNSFLFGIPKEGQAAASVCADLNQEANGILEEDRKGRAGGSIDWHSLLIAAAALAAIVGAAWFGIVGRAAVQSRLSRFEQVWGYLAISPWLIGFVLLGIGPIVLSLVLSFTRWNSLAPLSSARFAGAENYAAMLFGNDDLFLKSLRTTLLYTISSVPLHLTFGLVLALLLNSQLKGIAIFRTIYYLPAVMPAAATAVLFGWLFRQQGLLNYLLGGFGAVSFQQMPDWLNSPEWALPAVVLLGLWGVGGGMMIYLAGLQNIPTQLYEAAQLDGANAMTQFRVVTFPMLSPVLFFNLVMGIIGAFQVFTSPFVLFGGTPGADNAALFYSFYLYRKAFEQFQFGYGSALAWVLFVIILFFTLLVFRSSSFWVYYESQRDQRA